MRAASQTYTCIVFRCYCRCIRIALKSHAYIFEAAQSRSISGLEAPFGPRNLPVQSLSILNNHESAPEAAIDAPNSGPVVPDWLGIVASVGCAIHCAAMPFVITFLPMLGLSFLADEAFHKVMVGVCTLLALLAFVPGWRVHRRWLPAGIAVAGLTMIGVAAFALEDSCTCCTLPADSEVSTAAGTSEVVACSSENCEHCAQAAKANEQPAQASAAPMLAGFTPWITPLGGFFLVSAHLVNRRFSCQCGCCPTE
jgi:hypothetical protein